MWVKFPPLLTPRGLSRARRSVAGQGTSGGAACGGNAAALRRDCKCVGSGIFRWCNGPSGAGEENNSTLQAPPEGRGAHGGTGPPVRRSGVRQDSPDLPQKVPAPGSRLWRQCRRFAAGGSGRLTIQAPPTFRGSLVGVPPVSLPTAPFGGLTFVQGVSECLETRVLHPFLDSPCRFSFCLFFFSREKKKRTGPALPGGCVSPALMLQWVKSLQMDRQGGLFLWSS